jgi:diadenosine tetraphosphate (Ap4A) HIT family hydrolase
MDCPLCSPDLAPVIFESSHWRLVLNRNQDLLGKCFLVSKRHIESLIHLSTSEWNDLHEQATLATKLLEDTFLPDHFNYSFLQNLDRHVHMHIIPRYVGQRVFVRDVFKDEGYPGHYSVPVSVKKLSEEDLVKIADALRMRYEGR